MLSRRELLWDLAVARIAVKRNGSTDLVRPSLEIWRESHALSKESANGFENLLQSSGDSACPVGGHRRERPFVIAPGVRYLSGEQARELAVRVRAGAWLILETGSPFSPAKEWARQASTLHSAFGLETLPPVPVSPAHANEDLFVAYQWPIRVLARTFEAVTPIRCDAKEVVACFRGQPVCARKRVGEGGILYLGTMLGPGLFAGEREAHAVGSAMLSSSSLGI